MCLADDSPQWKPKDLKAICSRAFHSKTSMQNTTRKDSSGISHTLNKHTLASKTFDLWVAIRKRRKNIPIYHQHPAGALLPFSMAISGAWALCIFPAEWWNELQPFQIAAQDVLCIQIVQIPWLLLASWVMGCSWILLINQRWHSFNWTLYAIRLPACRNKNTLPQFSGNHR